jgi:hypothetical protein
MGSQYEDVVTPFLEHAESAENAMDALFQMGLLDKYVDLFVSWMKGGGPLGSGFGAMTYGMAASAFRRSQNAAILQTLIDASRDATEKWTSREHALGCLAIAIDIENAPLGERLPVHHPYFTHLLQKAEVALDDLRSGRTE